MRNRKRALFGVAVGLLVLGVAVRAALPWITERYANRQLAQIGEYSGRVENVDLSFIRGAYTLYGITIEKIGSTAETPFLDLDQIDISLQWGALLDGELVGELVMRRPVVNLIQGETDRDTQLGTGVNWPEQVRRFFPFRFNVVEVHDGTATFRAPGIETDDSLTLEQLRIVLRDLTNVEERQSAAFASLDVEGLIMGDAPITLSGRLDPNETQPTFDVDLAIRDAEVVEVNPWLREFVNADAESGTFSMYAELAAAEGRFEGYVKPIIENPQIFAMDEHADGPFQKAWEALVEIGAQLLKNRPEDQIATEVPLSGELEDPNVDMLTALMNLLRNAFVSAFSHTLEGSIGLKDVQLAGDDETATDGDDETATDGDDANRGDERRSDSQDERGRDGRE